MKRLTVWVLGGLALGVVGVWWLLPAAPPKSGPLYQDAAPALEEGHHSVHVAQTTIEMDPAAFRVWVKSNQMFRFLRPAGAVAPPVAFETISGDWPNSGAVRRSKLGDGHYVAEKVLESRGDEGFRYQVWGFTNSAGYLVRYAVSEFKYLDHGDGRTKLIWEYRMRARSRLLSPVVDWFLANQFAPFMDAGVAEMAAAAAAASKR